MQEETLLLLHKKENVGNLCKIDAVRKVTRGRKELCNDLLWCIKPLTQLS